jgi:hypothetical protein
MKPRTKNRHWRLLLEVAGRRDKAAGDAIRVFESQVEFARVQVRMRERMEEAAREAPAEARAYGTKARMQHVLDRLDIRAESLIEFVSDIHMQNAFMTSLENLERFAWEEYTGYPPEVLRPVNGEAHSDWETIHAKVQRWAYEGYKRLASLPKAQPEPKGETVSNADGVPNEPSLLVTASNHGDDGGTGRRAAVDAYIDEVFSKTKKRITRKDIWQSARYESRTEFERWERNDQKRPNQSAHERFTQILIQKPHLPKPRLK